MTPKNLLSPIISRRIMLWAALVGLFASVYLLITYTTGGPIVCGLAEGCEIVRASKWATTIGGLPRPVLGVIFYLGVIGLLGFRAAYPHRFVRRAYHLTMLAATVGFLESAFLTFVQWADIGAFCTWCLTSAAAATVIFIVSWFDRGHAMEEDAALRELQVLFWSFTMSAVIGAILLFALLGNRGNGQPPVIAPVSAASAPL